MTTTDLAAVLLEDVPRINGDRHFLVSEVLAALSAALDGVDERAVEVLEGVTPGKWEPHHHDDYSELAVYRPEFTGIGHVYEASDANFIAWCRNNVPALLAQIAALRAERDETYAYAKRLAEAIFAKGEFDAPQWRPLEDTLGVLTQIDNMVAGIRARAEAAEAEVEQLRGASKALASWCVKNIQLNLEMDTALHALDAALSATEATDDPR